MLTVRQFVEQSYQLISSSSPTVPLHGSNLSLGIRILNQLLDSYAATGLMLTIAATQSTTLTPGQQEVVCGKSTYLPEPEITAGRLCNSEEMWLELDGVTYPLIDTSESEFNESWKYEPLTGLPRFAIVNLQTEVTRIRLYPSASQAYEFFVRGKFQLDTLTSNSDMSSLPDYYQRYLQFALARDLSLYTGRAEAWTERLEGTYKEAKLSMESTSEVNLDVNGDRKSNLNGAFRVRAGI